eukprot:5666071-Amphidinium_carterae.1
METHNASQQKLSSPKSTTHSTVVCVMVGVSGVSLVPADFVGTSRPWLQHGTNVEVISRRRQPQQGMLNSSQWLDVRTRREWHGRFQARESMSNNHKSQSQQHKEPKR